MPIYKHDCDQCEFLGSEELSGGMFDGYYCTQGGNLPTIVMRFGNEGQEYHSYSPDMIENTPIPQMTETMLLALRFYTKVFTKKELLHRER